LRAALARLYVWNQTTLRPLYKSARAGCGNNFRKGQPATERPMELVLIILVLVLLFGGGGYWGRRRGHW